MSQQAKAFINELNNNEQLKNDLQSVLKSKFSDVEKYKEQADGVIVDFASDHGYDFTPEELQTANKEWKNAQTAELSDKALEQVSGGSPGDTYSDSNMYLPGFDCIF